MRKKNFKRLSVILAASMVMMCMPAYGADVKEVADTQTEGAQSDAEEVVSDDAAANEDVSEESSEQEEKSVDEQEMDLLEESDDADVANNDGYYNIISGMYYTKFQEAATGIFYYSDDYFKESATAKNSHLRTMSDVLAITTFDESGNAYTKDVLEQTDFEDITSYGMEKGENISATFAHKNIDGNELVAVVIGVYDESAGWASNLNIGSSGDAEGFAEAAKTVAGYLDTYLNEKNVTANKIWAMGYSRGGAVADLLGKYLNQNASSLGVSQDDIYVYTFEAPHTTTDDVAFNNIHNVVDENDIITYIVPDSWGFTNCGIKEVVNINNKKLKKKQLDFMKVINGDNKMTKNAGTTTYAAFIKEFMNWVTSDDSINRDKYVEIIQDDAIALGEIFGGMTQEERQAYTEYFDNEFTKAITSDENKSRIFMALVKAVSGDSEEEKQAIDEAVDIITSILDQDAAKKVFSSDEIETMKKAISDTASTLFYVVLEDFAVTQDLGSDSSRYNNVVDKHSSDYNNNEIKDVTSSQEEEDSWYAGYNVGYDAGYEQGVNDTKYDSSPTEPQDKVSSKSAYESGYKYGYYEGYLMAVDYGEVSYILGKTTTMIENATALVDVHYPNNSVKVVEKQDSYYTDAPAVGVSEGKGASATGTAIAGGNVMNIIVLILAIVICGETTILIASRNKKKGV